MKHGLIQSSDELNKYSVTPKGQLLLPYLNKELDDWRSLTSDLMRQREAQDAIAAEAESAQRAEAEAYAEHEQSQSDAEERAYCAGIPDNAAF